MTIYQVILDLVPVPLGLCAACLVAFAFIQPRSERT